MRDAEDVPLGLIYPLTMLYWPGFFLFSSHTWFLSVTHHPHVSYLVTAFEIGGGFRLSLWDCPSLLSITSQVSLSVPSWPTHSPNHYPCDLSTSVSIGDRTWEIISCYCCSKKSNCVNPDHSWRTASVSEWARMDGQARRVMAGTCVRNPAIKKRGHVL